MKSILLSLFILLAQFSLLLAQNKTVPILERKITFSLTNEKLPAALQKLERAGGFSFSYNTNIISTTQTISIDVVNKSVREILNNVFKGTIHYKEKSNHLILSKAPPVKIASTTTVFIISGYVEDGESGNRVADASVYEKSSLTSAVTDSYGYYKIKLDKKNEPVNLSVSKKNYRDTVVMVTAPGNQYINIAIRPAGDSIAITASIAADSSEKVEMPFPYESEANVENIHDTLYREIQASIFPFVGTNGRLGGNVINDYSINFFGGYSLGTRKVELGVFFNADRGDVSWLQIAGFGNAVGGNVYGIQASGFFNANRGETKAIQLAGFANTNLLEFRGVQLAGFANTNIGPAQGVQLAGFSNFTQGTSTGFQAAGFDNIQIGNYEGSQVAGFTNVATGQINGSQIAGFFNYAGRVKGTQIGLFNYADTLGGVPIGLVSFVNHGYHKIEVSADEVFYTNLAFRTGVRRFYNIISAGMKPEKAFGNNQNVWSFGYGVGTAPRLASWLDLNVDLTSSQVNKGGFTSELSLLNKLYVGVDMRLTRKMSFTIGGTLNGYLTKIGYNDYPQLFTDYQPHIFNDHDFRTHNLKMWLGFKAGLRFL